MTKPKRNAGASAREPEARLVVNLPVHVHRLVKSRAAANGRSIREYILELLQREGIQ